MADDYTIQIALLSEIIGYELDSYPSKDAPFWSFHERLPGNGAKWITLATGTISHTPKTGWINSYPAFHVTRSEANPAQDTPDPRFWTIISTLERGDGHRASRVLWPPVPFDQLINLLENPKFREEYMLPKRRRQSGQL